MLSNRVPFTCDRRRFLAAGLAAGVAAIPLASAMGSEERGFFVRHGLPVGLQLYAVSDAARADINGTLAKVALIGYRTVELAGFHGHDVATLRAAADRAGLEFTSIHITAQPRGADPGLEGDIGRLCAELRVLGIKRVVMPMFLIPPKVPPLAGKESFIGFVARAAEHLTLDDWKRTAAFLNDRGNAFKREGMQFGYHNHNPEFAPLRDTTGFEVLMRETQPDLVSFEMDAGWVAAAGIEPAQLLIRYPGRFRQMHVKDLLPSTQANYRFQQDPTEVGRGIIQWRTLLPAAHSAGIREFFVEQEPPFTKDRFDALGESFSYLEKVG